MASLNVLTVELRVWIANVSLENGCSTANFIFVCVCVKCKQFGHRHDQMGVVLHSVTVYRRSQESNLFLLKVQVGIGHSNLQELAD